MAPLQLSLPERTKMAASVNNFKFTVLQSQRRGPRYSLQWGEAGGSVQVIQSLSLSLSLCTLLCGLICKCILVRLKLPSQSSIFPLPLWHLWFAIAARNKVQSFLMCAAAQKAPIALRRSSHKQLCIPFYVAWLKWVQIFVNINMVWQAAMQMTLLLRESADCNEVNTTVRFL